MNIDFKKSNKTYILGTIMFNILDKDHSKSITKDEWLKYAKICALTTRQIEDKIKEMDKDKNGKIDFHEFMNWFKVQYQIEEESDDYD